MPTALLTMEDSHHFAPEFSHDSFDADSLSGLHTAWLDDEQLNNLPIMDVFADISTPKAGDSSTEAANTAEKTQEQSSAKEPEINAALGDHDAQLLDAALDFSFDTELSPILEPFADTTVTMSPLRMQRRLSKSPRTRRTSSSPMRRAPTVTTPRQVSRTVEQETAPLAVAKRPRTRSSSWQEQEQNTFFAMFKVKWPPTPEGEQTPPFSSLLLERFDAISTKVRTKSVMEVRQFYASVMQNIAEMLDVVDNDIDLNNPDEVRIAVWCWRKLVADTKHEEDFEVLESDPASVKPRLANVLLQSIIRSRRQMLKAKSDSAAANNDKSAVPGITSISAWVSRSNLSSFFAKGSVPAPENPTVRIHHPMVRKKHPVAQSAMMPPSSFPPVSDNVTKALSRPTVQHRNVESPGRALKRMRSVSTDRSPAPGSAKKTRHAEMDDLTFTSPPPSDKRSRSRTRNGVAFHTPQQSRKKIYIKMRMVPRDKETKANVVRCGCRPKVELKLSSTKKISEITDHMSKKWAKVRPLLPKGAVLCFFQKNGTNKWSKEDSNVTCFDIWKHCGKQTNGENVVEVSYLWRVPEESDVPAADENVQVQDMMPLVAPSGLFEQEVAAQVLSSGDESETAQLSPACGLQEFGEKVAFDRSITAEAKEEVAALEALISNSGDEDLGEEYSPSTGSLRRRIQPVLVSKEEFDI
ncbi:Threonylcarbamoyl-AMP synthase [Phytophthora cinnamomi]|uniref:Threonylcarbamoyl-AMP synthase n=1 Tax=Phytophthora cinnamomi TaxID=4785 RepID=UPI00355ACCAF|nr:Threonylcarbamoyl-AMP synthase [Phytophthora cinnamomi]